MKCNQSTISYTDINLKEAGKFILLTSRTFCAGCVPRAGMAAETPAGPAEARLPGQVPRQDRRAARGK